MPWNSLCRLTHFQTFSIKYLIQNLDLFKEQLGDYEDDYLIIDCPGQIELYSHMDLMRKFVDFLQDEGYRIVGVYVLDSQFLVDSAKFISGTLACLSAMIRLEIPHINVLTKMDLLGKKGNDDDFMDKFINPDIPTLIHDLKKTTDKRFHKLNEAIGSLIDEHNLVAFIPLDPTKQDNVEYVLSHADNAMQYGEDLDVKVPKDFEEDEEEAEYDIDADQ